MTLTELKDAVLQELGVLAVGESPTHADAMIVGNRYAELYDMLLTEGLVTWADDDPVPEFAAKPITMMVAYMCAGSFGVPPAKRMELELAGALNLATAKGGPSEAERQLRRQLAKSFVYYPQATEYF